MSIDSIFLNQFNANNRFIDETISDINNYIETSDISNLISCCQVICENENSFERNNKILNDIKENMEIFKPKIDKLQVRFYCFDTAQMFKFLVAYSKAVVNSESEEKIQAIYKNLMIAYNTYISYKNKF